MPIDNITVNSTSNQGGLLKQLESNLQNAVNLASQILNLMNQQTDGTTYTTIESQWGLTSGNGQTTYNLVAGLAGAGGALTVSAVTQFLARMN